MAYSASLKKVLNSLSILSHSFPLNMKSSWSHWSFTVTPGWQTKASIDLFCSLPFQCCTWSHGKPHRYLIHVNDILFVPVSPLEKHLSCQNKSFCFSFVYSGFVYFRRGLSFLLLVLRNLLTIPYFFVF